MDEYLVVHKGCLLYLTKKLLLDVLALLPSQMACDGLCAWSDH